MNFIDIYIFIGIVSAITGAINMTIGAYQRTNYFLKMSGGKKDSVNFLEFIYYTPWSKVVFTMTFQFIMNLTLWPVTFFLWLRRWNRTRKVKKALSKIKDIAIELDRLFQEDMKKKEALNQPTEAHKEVSSMANKLINTVDETSKKL